MELLHGSVEPSEVVFLNILAHLRHLDRYFELCCESSGGYHRKVLSKDKGEIYKNKMAYRDIYVRQSHKRLNWPDI